MDDRPQSCHVPKNRNRQGAWGRSPHIGGPGVAPRAETTKEWRGRSPKGFDHTTPNSEWA
ncbi:hypothetical protein GCM10023088_62510 [Actinomadura verrucosospora]